MILRVSASVTNVAPFVHIRPNFDNSLCSALFNTESNFEVGSLPLAPLESITQARRPDKCSRIFSFLELAVGFCSPLPRKQEFNKTNDTGVGLSFWQLGSRCIWVHAAGSPDNSGMGSMIPTLTRRGWPMCFSRSQFAAPPLIPGSRRDVPAGKPSPRSQSSSSRSIRTCLAACLNVHVEGTRGEGRWLANGKY